VGRYAATRCDVASNDDGNTPTRTPHVPTLDLSCITDGDFAIGAGEAATAPVGRAIGNAIAHGQRRPSPCAADDAANARTTFFRARPAWHAPDCLPRPVSKIGIFV
jgi:hypothetical protein